MLSLNQISKSFGPVEVLKGISLQLVKGKVLGLVGENGAGKSTLMNIMAGIHQPSGGHMLMEGVPFEPQNAGDSLSQGIAFIHQELNLFRNLTVSENLFINSFPRKRIAGCSVIDRVKAKELTKELLVRVGLEVDPSTVVGNLSTAQQQLVEIAKALAGNPRIIIFDEPTTALSRHESESLFELITELKSQDIAMVYISHNLDDILQLSDHIAVLRDGALISTGEKGDYSIGKMIKEMVGRDLDSFFPDKESTPVDQIVLEVNDLKSDVVNTVSFKVQQKEILGFYGLVGAGRSEMAKALMGLDPVKSGSINWKGSNHQKWTPRGWIKQGVVMLTEDRREEGLLVSKSIRKNIQLASYPDFTNNFNLIKYDKINREAATFAETTRIKFNNLDTQEVGTLSGGNQQKVVLSKWLMTNPQLLILDEPTKGIDIGAKQEIYSMINKLVDQGASTIMISSEIEELIGMCDRILVMNSGRITAEFDRQHFDKNAILEAALTSNF